MKTKSLILIPFILITSKAYAQVPGSDLPALDATGHFSCARNDQLDRCVDFFNHVNLGADAGNGLVWSHDGQGWVKVIPTIRNDNGGNNASSQCSNGNAAPYLDPACAVKNTPGYRDDGWRFKIGKTYVHPYFELSVTILGILVNTHGVSVYVGETKEGELKQYPIGDNPRLYGFYQEQ